MTDEIECKEGKCPQCGEPNTNLWKFKGDWYCVDCAIEKDVAPKGYFEHGGEKIYMVFG